MGRFTFILAAAALFTAAACTSVKDLSGTWEFQLDPDGTVVADGRFEDTIDLPGTTDLAGKGPGSVDTGETARLTRRHPFVGKAWYRRMVTVPGTWKGKDVSLFLERTKATELYVDGRPAGTCNDISTPQTYDLGRLGPGRHTIAIMVDNGGGVPSGVIHSSHMYSEDTQTNWNGIIGRIGMRVGTQRAMGKAGRLPRLEIIDGMFMAGGHKVFLRGKHDACVFPLTGHTPMDKASWLEYFGTCREYGINHVRFHSWCPPEAAFQAADELGIYLQPELPFWGTLKGDELLDFLRKEGLNILRTYGHHPSFALFSLGNELSGDTGPMQELVGTFRKEAPWILYTNGTNSFLGYKGYVEGMDFQATCRTGAEPYGEYGTHVRSSFAFCDAMDGGILNHFHPGTTVNFAEALETSPVPVISHETGQFQSYPDYSEIEKYTGPLVPYNLMEFRRRLEEAGMAGQAADFHRASGSWAALLYRADIEMCLRTPGLGGFQLLDIQDYPGQGSAYVGILDAFMDDKGFVDKNDWTGWCGETVPLAEFEKYCWTSEEVFLSRVKAANFSRKDMEKADWALSLADGTPVSSGSLDCPSGEGLLDLGEISYGLSGIKDPARLTLAVEVRTKGGSPVRNEWPVWVYPAGPSPDHSGITVSRRLGKTELEVLGNGGKVLLMPSDTANSVGGLFQTDYWNYRMFKRICENNGKPVSPGTMGLLTDPGHPLFKEFPTEEHTDWQWFPVLKASHPMILDGLKDYRPLVQVIDNIERNHRLGLVFEFKLGGGKLLVCCSDLEKASEYPEGRQFYKAVLDYMRSDDFDPATPLGTELPGII